AFVHGFKSRCVSMDGSDRMRLFSYQRPGENTHSMVFANKTVAESIVSSHMGRVKRGRNTVSTHVASISSIATTVNATAYEITAATFSLRLCASTASKARFAAQKHRKPA